MTDRSRIVAPTTEPSSPSAEAPLRTRTIEQAWQKSGRQLNRLGAWSRKRPVRAIVLGALLGLSLIFLGIWKLPELLVNEDLVRGVDRQKAYNDARTPIGVVLAGTLAAIAAGLGVWINHRNVSETRNALDLTRATHEEDVAIAAVRETQDRVQWRQEFNSQRYQEASGQLGNESPAVRLAGVYAMGRLADEWSEGAQSCIDVLCSQVRLTPEGTEQRQALVNSTVLALIGDHLQSNAAISWAEYTIDFRRTRIAGLSWRNIRAEQLLLEDAILEGATVLTGRLGGECKLARIHISGDAELSLQGPGGQDLRDFVITGKTVSITLHPPGLRPWVRDVQTGEKGGLVTDGAQLTIDFSSLVRNGKRSSLGLMRVKERAIVRLYSNEQALGQLNFELIDAMGISPTGTGAVILASGEVHRMRQEGVLSLPKQVDQQYEGYDDEHRINGMTFEEALDADDEETIMEFRIEEM